MTEPPDLETLARRYLDLWQDHLGSMARDPAVSEALAHAFSLMTQGLAEAARNGPAPAGGHHDPSDPSDPSDPPRPTPGGGATRTGAAGVRGTQAAGAASGRAESVDDELAARVERLEQRIAVLEAALGGLLSRAGGGGGKG